MKEAHVAYLQILIEWNDKVLLIKGLIIFAGGSWKNKKLHLFSIFH